MKPRRWKAVTDPSAFQHLGMALQSYSPGEGFGGPGVAVTTCTKTQPSAHPRRKGHLWRAGPGSVTAASPAEPDGDLQELQEQPRRRLFPRLHRAEEPSGQPQRVKLEGTYRRYLSEHLVQKQKHSSSCICLIAAFPNENAPYKTFWISIEKLILKS